MSHVSSPDERRSEVAEADDDRPSEAFVAQYRHNTLETNYEPHDVLEAFAAAKLEARDFSVEQYGRDDRDAETGKVLYGGKPDLKVFDDGDLVGFVEIKSKTSHDWYPRLNLDHLQLYYHGETDLTESTTVFPGEENMLVPTYLVFGVVDTDDDLVTRHGVYPVVEPPTSDSSGTFFAHGHWIYEYDYDDERSFAWLERELRDV